MANLNLPGPDNPFRGVVGPFSYSHLDFYRRWVERGFHGEMDYMAHVEKRQSLDALVPGVRSVLAFGFPYPFDRRNALRRPTPGEYKIAQFSLGKDYHKRIKGLLRPVARTLGGTSKVFCDSGTLMEKETAQHAGLGFVGKHTLLIHPGCGSAFMLGFILTTAEVEPTPVPKFPGCGRCLRCLSVCPTGALAAPYTLDARKCISYATLESVQASRDPSPRWGYVYGCDLCQAVCPYNAGLKGWRDAPPSLDPERVSPERLEQNREMIRDERTPLVIAQDGLEFPLNPTLTAELFSIAGDKAGEWNYDGTAFNFHGAACPTAQQAALTAFFRKTQLVKMERPFRFIVAG